MTSAEGLSLPWHLVDHYEAIEMRANAFAADLLAPTEGVRALIGHLDPTSLDALRRVCAHYQIGVTAGLNRLTNTFRLSREQRDGMKSRLELAKATGKLSALLPESHADAVEPGAQLRDSTFVDLILRARAAGVIDGVEAREHLRLRMSDPLPEHPGLTAEQRSALITPEARAHSAAVRYLMTHAEPELFAAPDPSRTPEGWEVEVLRWVSRTQSEHAGVLRLDPEFRIEEPAWLAEKGR